MRLSLREEDSSANRVVIEGSSCFRFVEVQVDSQLGWMSDERESGRELCGEGLIESDEEREGKRRKEADPATSRFLSISINLLE